MPASGSVSPSVWHRSCALYDEKTVRTMFHNDADNEQRNRDELDAAAFPNRDKANL